MKREELKSEHLEDVVRLEKLIKEINKLTGLYNNINIPHKWYNYTETSDPLDKPYIILDCENSKNLYSYIKEEKYLLEDGNTLREMWRPKDK